MDIPSDVTVPAGPDTDAARQRFACTRLGLAGDRSFEDLTSAAESDATCELGAQLCDALDAAQAEAQRLHDDAQAFDLRRPAVQAFIVRKLAQRAYLTEGEAWDDLSAVFAAVAGLPGRDRDDAVEELVADPEVLP